MAKFKSGLADIKDAKGTVTRQIRVWLPLTRAGLLEPIVDDAVAAGVLLKEDKTPYTQPELEAERVKIRAEFRALEAADIKKRRPY